MDLLNAIGSSTKQQLIQRAKDYGIPYSKKNKNQLKEDIIRTFYGVNDRFLKKEFRKIPDAPLLRGDTLHPDRQAAERRALNNTHTLLNYRGYHKEQRKRKAFREIDERVMQRLNARYEPANQGKRAEAILSKYVNRRYPARLVFYESSRFISRDGRKMASDYKARVKKDNLLTKHPNQLAIANIERIRKLCRSTMREYFYGFYFKMAENVNMEKNVGGTLLKETKYFGSKKHRILIGDTDYAIDQKILEAIEEMQAQLEDFILNGSDWHVVDTAYLYLELTSYTSANGSRFIRTPPYVPAGSIINVVNNDNMCFKYAVLAGLFGCDYENMMRQELGKGYRARLERTDTQLYAQWERQANFNGIEYPVDMLGIDKFEALNPTVRINVYTYDKESHTFITYRISKNDPNKKLVMLLLLEEEERTVNEMGKQQIDYRTTHYTCIKDFGKLLTRRTNHNGKIYPCTNCLHCFNSKRLLDDHETKCIIDNKQSVKQEMPKKGSTTKFENYSKMMKAPFVIYADFESYHIKPERKEKLSNTTDLISRQEVNSYSLLIVRSDGESYGPYTGCDGDLHFDHARSADFDHARGVISSFLHELDNAEEFIMNYLNNGLKPLEGEELRKADEAILTAAMCWICNKEFTADNQKVRDHCHITGKFRGIAHSSCNTMLRIKKDEVKIPVVFHNLRGYDSHLIISEIGNHRSDKPISCIPNNEEKYMSFSYGRLTFIDSFQFFQTSLANLVKSLKPEDMKIHRKYLSEKGFELSKKKGIYPYEWVDGVNKFDEKELPPIPAFYSTLSDEGIKKEDYERAKDTWKALECKTFKDYHMWYLNLDVYHLAAFFEKFRDSALSVYKVDPAKYLSIAGFAFDALLKYTEGEVELITDKEIFEFVMRSKRGGNCFVGKRFARANNPMVPGYDPNKPKTWIVYEDANSLYAHIMKEPMPTGGYRMERPTLDEILATEDDGKRSGMAEVDFHFPRELHDKFNSFPPAPEVFTVPERLLSNKQRSLYAKLYGGPLSHSATAVRSAPARYKTTEKLIPHLLPHRNYIMHYRNIKLLHSLGVKFTKVHRAVTFNQSRWIEKFITLNIESRKKAVEDFMSNLFKIMNNAPFGKTMEDLTKRMTIKLLRSTDSDQLRKIFASNRFISRKIFGESLIAVHTSKVKITMNKPVIVGMCILELSKLHMYDFWYNVIHRRYGGKAALLYTDTDSLIMEIETEDVYKDVVEDRKYYDLSAFGNDNHCFAGLDEKTIKEMKESNKAVTGMFKDETKGEPIYEFVGLRPKMYSVLTAKEQKKKAKGVSKLVVEKKIFHNDYKDALFSEVGQRHSQTRIMSKSHKIMVIEQVKSSLSSFDNKRYILDDNINTYAYGHYKVGQEVKVDLEKVQRQLPDNYFVQEGDIISGIASDQFLENAHDKTFDCINNHPPEFIRLKGPDGLFENCGREYIIRNEHRGTYLPFYDPITFAQYENMLKPSERCLHEVIRGEEEQKIRFDIDAKLADVESIPDEAFGLAGMRAAEVPPLTAQEKMDYIINELLELILSKIKELYDMELTREDLIVTDSSWSTAGVKAQLVKFSFHIFTIYHFVENALQARKFCEAVLKDFNPRFSGFVDRQIYKSIQCFRLPDSTKKGESRFNVLTTRYGTGKFNFYEDKFIAKKWQGISSFAIMLDSVFDNNEKRVSKCTDFGNVGEQCVTKIVAKLEADNITEGFNFRSVGQGNLLFFDRTMPTHCRLCNQMHHKDNTLMIAVRKDGVYEMCRHSKTNEKIYNEELDLVPGSRAARSVEQN